MTIKVGINGFGRIGRMVFRAAARDFADIEIVGINDLLEPAYLAYMLKYDSVHGRFKGDIAVDGNTLVVNGRRIRLTAVKDPAELEVGRRRRRRRHRINGPVPRRRHCAEASGRRRKEGDHVGPVEGRDADVRLWRESHQVRR